MPSKTREIVVICRAKQAMEMIPVAITRAKYPGNRFAAVRESAFCLIASTIGDFRSRFFVAAFTVQFEAEARGAALLSQNPRAIGHGRNVSQVLSMPARQYGAPMLLVVLIEIYDLLLHRSSRT